MAGRLQGQTAMVTGCARSARAGATARPSRCCSRGKERASSASTRIPTLPPRRKRSSRARTAFAGPRSPMSPTNNRWPAVAACLDDFGRLDILVNNVGIARVGGPAEFEESAWDEVMRVNVKSAYLTCRHVLRQWSGRGQWRHRQQRLDRRLGLVRRELRRVRNQQGAMVSMTRSIAIQYARKGIRANCVCRAC